MRVLMLGWDLPPQTTGGLGVAVAGLATALTKLGVDLTLILPRKQPTQMFPFNIKFAGVKNGNYVTSYSDVAARNHFEKNFSNQDLLAQVKEFKNLINISLAGESYDIIHANDWLCGPSALEACEMLKKPLVVQIHSTEFDRNGGNGVGGEIYQIEKEIMEKARKVITVSAYTKKIINSCYQIPEEKIEVIHNGLDHDELEKLVNKKELSIKNGGRKLIVFAGRLALQKGPDWFLKAAQIVARYDKNAFFVLAGEGDMKGEIVNLAVNLGISDRVIFTGFLTKEELAAVYTSADVFVVPSVSEPFGLVALEASFFGTPLIITKNSGALELLNHCLIVDFWDSLEIAAKILAVLKYKELNSSLKNNAQAEVVRFTWEKAAKKCLSVYEEVVI